MRRLKSSIMGVLLLLAAAGCQEQLVVENTNNPDVERALARPSDVEAFVAGQFRQVYNALWTTGGINPQLLVAGLESYSGNANFGMSTRGSVPRSLVDNSRGNGTDYYDTFQSLSQVARAEAVALSRLDDPSFTFFPTSEAQRQRARAFAYFVKGVALGYMAMIFDSAAVILPADDPQQCCGDNPANAAAALVAYDSVMKIATRDLDSAVAIASRTPTGGNGFPIPTTGPSWLQTTVAMTGGSTGNFARLARSFKARFLAGVARTPAERAAVNWDSVSYYADPARALQTDFTIQGIAASGWTYGSGSGPAQMNTFQSWHQMWAIMVGMADTSGAYQTWLGTARGSKGPFIVATPDLRFPRDVSRPAQNAAPGLFLRNRVSGQDVQVDGLYYSFYDFTRFSSYFAAASTGPLVYFPARELSMLRAEAAIRLGQFPTAVMIIDSSRTARGLAPMGAIADLNTLVQGGASSCVPRVPTGATVTANATPAATACGNIMEAMKYEKRWEIAFVYPGGWWIEGRGWGDLPVQTPLHFPVPYTELDARRQSIYSVTTAYPTGAGMYTAAERLQPAAAGSTSNYGLGH